ncbi:immunoglobulin E-set superfamily protein [Actinidia rufa]|uniref:Immunoglobulin E-set superfamily protein n=1 Tax=Actinidia rufa TaxID=165716 RepID=A0A7J0EYG2_9ERIC|nr:immunoglobulin E-set superfamily protein [Actinidia rufa]
MCCVEVSSNFGPRGSCCSVSDLHDLTTTPSSPSFSLSPLRITTGPFPPLLQLPQTTRLSFSFFGGLASSSNPSSFWVTHNLRFAFYSSVYGLFLLMSLAIGVVSSSKNMGFDGNKDGNKEVDKSNKGGTITKPEGNDDEAREKIEREMSESSLCATEDEDENENESDVEGKIELGPQFTIKEQLEKDKDDESLRKWKEQLLGSVDINSIGETLEPEVKILSLAIKSSGRPDIFLPVPESGNPKGLWFTLKEGSRYSLKFAFQVSNNIVSGLKYTNTVWKTGVKVDSTKEMLGMFSPQLEPYTHEMPEETTPSGFFARGTYSARTKFLDDDNKCYLEINYTFDIRKDWQ